MKIPTLTPLQVLVLETLIGRDSSGKDVRAALAKHGVKKSGPAFYQLMARMEDGDMVKGWYEQKIVDGQIIKERWYKAQGAGIRAYNSTRAFYLERAGLPGGKGVAHA